MNSYSIFTLLIALILGYGCTNIEGDLTEKLEEVDAIFSDWEGQRPGGAVGIIKDGQLIYERYFGLANLEKGESFSKETITDIGSISKQFTAMCIALLEENGQLTIDEDIRKYLPELPEYPTTVKIKHLLFHTSGIKDQEELMLLKGLEPYGDYMTNEYALNLIFKQQSLNFPPATKYEYSNANYVLLTEIINRVSGLPLETYAKEHIFQPLGMQATFFNLNQGADFPLKAVGYVPTDNGFEKAFYETHVIGDGGVYTPLRDMLLWDNNFYQNKLGKGKNSLMERMKYREKLTNGSSNNMAFAQINTMHPFGKESWSHGGGGGGYRSFYIRLEDAKFSVIVLSNADNSNAFDKANQVVNLFLDSKPIQTNKEQKSLAKKTIESIKINEKEKQLFNGFYMNEAQLLVLDIQFKEANKQFTIKWLNGDDKGYDGVLIADKTIAEKEDINYKYELSSDQKELLHKIGERTDIVFQKLPAPKADLTEYQGKYYSEELDHNITLNLSEQFLQSPNTYLTNLIPIAEDKFLDKSSKAIISFERNAINQIIKLKVDIPRGDRSLRNMIFRKVIE